MSNDEKIVEVVGQAIRAELRPDRKDAGPLYLDHDVHEYESLARAAINALAAADVAPQEPSRLPDFFAPKPMPNGYVPVPQESSDAWVDRQLSAEVAAKTGTSAPSPDREKLIAVRLYCENQGDKFRHHAERILEMLDSSDAPADVERQAEWFGGSE